jgi:predicted RNase H-like nuclease (RuvC/YqgF family)
MWLYSTSNTEVMVTERDQLLILIGELKEGVAGLKSDLEEMRTEFREERGAATQSRQKIFEKQEDAERRIERMEGTITVLGGVIDKQTRRIDALEPTVKETVATVRRWSVRGGLVATGLIAIGSFLWWMLTSNWSTIWNWVAPVLKAITK